MEKLQLRTYRLKGVALIAIAGLALFALFQLSGLVFAAASTTATRVYGQAGDFTTATSSTTADGLKQPFGVTVDSAGGIYVADTSNHRVLHFTGTSTTADRVYGQVNFTTNITGTTTTNLYSPYKVAVDTAVGGGIYVADSNNSRVLHFTGTSTTADRVYGQGGSFTTRNTTTSSTGLFTPRGVAVEPSGAGIYIADTLNSRVLHFSNTNIFPDRVYGQTDYNTQGGNLGATGLYNPSDVKVDTSVNGGIYVVDTSNHRVLHFTGTSTTADRVYGQPDFTTGTSSTTATGLRTPYGVALDTAAGGGIYVADSFNYRILHFSGTSTTADVVYGQPDFTTRTPDFPSASTLSLPSGVAVDATGNLYVADSFNSRALYFGTASGAASITAVLGTPQSTVVNTAFFAPLRAQVTDSSNMPVSGVSVTFTAPSTGPSGTFVGGSTTFVGTTDMNGNVTTSAFTANAITGSYNVTATVGGVTTPATFALTNTAASSGPAIITAYAGSYQDGLFNTPFYQRLVAQVTDSSNAPVSGASVTFTAPSTGPSGTFAGGSTTYVGTTDASGLVTATVFTANAIAGGYNVTATVNGVANPAYFTLYNHASCDGLVVTSITDDGLATTCGTLSFALSVPNNGTQVKTITFALDTGNTITFTDPLTSKVQPKTVIDGGTGIVINGNGVSGDGLHLQGQDTLLNLIVKRFAGKEIVTEGPGNQLSRVRVQF